ncbi:hypothetical protein SAMN04488057_106175 [Cyclobacterium lianum]|uniref:RES domain-containing protein n=1 Tax=Cyclobacterium lianum TaxID=388280 RepID=A0A1M7NZE9_9BACT|nr:hypothetical protein SAMN04488057_106175 [Cyclobacterium lianum]
MKVYRIEREKYLKSTLTGQGAALTDGFRWNSRNTYLVYTSASRALPDPIIPTAKAVGN